MAKAIYGREPSFFDQQPQYRNRVLIGNWVEDRLKFTREYPPCYTSVAKNEFRERGPVTVERDTRRRLRVFNDGLDREFLLVHHGKAYNKNNITSYDQDYNQFPNLKIDSIKLKALKPWEVQKQLKTTNLQLPRCTLPPMQHARPSGYNSETSDSFCASSAEARQRHRYSTPRHLSTDLFQPNLSTKGWGFRNGSLFMVPEYVDLPQLHKPQAAADDPDFMALKPELSTRFPRYSTVCKPCLGMR